MARINCVGLDELADFFTKNSGISASVKGRMLTEAGRKAAEATRISADLHGLRRTGQLNRSIKAGPVTLHSDSASVEVWPQGNRRGGERNAVVGFVQEYGRSYGRRRRPSTNFFAEAAESAADDVVQVMRDIWREEM